MSTSYIVCDSCAVVLANADMSHVHEDRHATVLSFAESVNVAHVGEADMGGYWDCPSCGDVQIGTGQKFEAIEEDEADAETRAILADLDRLPSYCVRHADTAPGWFNLVDEDHCQADEH